MVRIGKIGCIAGQNIILIATFFAVIDFSNIYPMKLVTTAALALFMTCANVAVAFLSYRNVKNIEKKVYTVLDYLKVFLSITVVMILLTILFGHSGINLIVNLTLYFSGVLFMYSLMQMGVEVNIDTLPFVSNRKS